MATKFDSYFEKRKSEGWSSAPTKTALAPSASTAPVKSKPGFFSDPETGMNIVKGATKGLFSTIASMGKLGTETFGKLVGAQDISGTSEMVEKAKSGGILTPKNTAQSLGYGAEQIAELFIPLFGEEAVASKIGIALAEKGAGKLATGATKLAGKSVAQGIDIGVKRTAQTGDVEEGMTEGAVMAGATPFLEGGAAITKGVIRSISPETKSLITKAVRPTGKAARSFESQVDEALPVMAKYADQIVSSETPLKTFVSAGKAAKAELWKSVEQGLKGAEGADAVSGDVIANAIRQAAKNEKTLIENPALIEKIEAKAKSYEGKQFSPLQAESILETTNAQTQAYYSKTGVGKSLAERSDPELSADLMLADAIRGELDRIISTADASFSGLKKKYGAISSIVQHAEARIPVAERQDIMSLAEQISGPRTAGNVAINLFTGRYIEGFMSMADIGVAKGLKSMERSDAKISRAFSRISKDVKSGKIVPFETPNFERPQYPALPEGKSNIPEGDSLQLPSRPPSSKNTRPLSQTEAVTRLREMGYSGPLTQPEMQMLGRKQAKSQAEEWVTRRHQTMLEQRKSSLQSLVDKNVVKRPKAQAPISGAKLETPQIKAGALSDEGQIDKFVYHETSDINLAKIKSQGLTPKQGMYGKGVYFSQKIGEGEASGRGTIIRINKNSLPKDYQEFPSTEKSSGEGWTNANLSPELLEYSEDGGKTWKKLISPK